MKYLMMVLCSISLFIVGSTIAYASMQNDVYTEEPTAVHSDNVIGKKEMKDARNSHKPCPRDCGFQPARE